MEHKRSFQAIASSNERNHGIDLLRILCMFSIVLLHVLGEGGVGQKVIQHSKNYYAYLSLRFLNEFAVDAFGMISGYVMYKSRPKLSRLILLWFEVLFYSAGISALFILFNRSSIPSARAELYSMLLPITGNRYWYMSSYFGLFFFIPVLNAGIEKLSKHELQNTIVGLFILICVLGSFNTSRNDPFAMNYGFSTAWLCVLYLAGGIFRKYNTFSYIRIWQALLGIIACVWATVTFKSLMDTHRWRLSYTLDWMLMSNVSVTYTLTAFFMLSLFVKIRPGKRAQQMITLLSPAALGVYLIHVHPMIWSNFITGRFAFLAKLHWLPMLLGALAIAFSIFAVCLLIDLGRIYLFRLLRLEHLCRHIEQFIVRFTEHV